MALIRLFGCLLFVVLAAIGNPLFAEEKPARVDQFGDPLPQGAIARLGTTRLRIRPLELAFESEGEKRLITADYLGTISFWDSKTGQRLKEHKHQLARAYQVVFSWNLRRYAILNGEGNVSVYDMATGQQLYSLDVGDHSTRIGISADGKSLVTSTSRVGLKYWNLAKDKATLSWQSPGECYGLFFSPSGDWIIALSGGQLYRIKISDGSIHPLEISPGKKGLILISRLKAKSQFVTFRPMAG